MIFRMPGKSRQIQVFRIYGTPNIQIVRISGNSETPDFPNFWTPPKRPCSRSLGILETPEIQICRISGKSGTPDLPDVRKIRKPEFPDFRKIRKPEFPNFRKTRKPELPNFRKIRKIGQSFNKNLIRFANFRPKRSPIMGQTK